MLTTCLALGLGWIESSWITRISVSHQSWGQQEFGGSDVPSMWNLLAVGYLGLFLYCLENPVQDKLPAHPDIPWTLQGWGL